MEQRSPRNGIKTPIAPPPSLLPSLPPHTLHSFILYLYELPFSTTDNCTNKSCKIFRKDKNFNEEDNFAHIEEEEEDEGDDIIHKY